MRVSFVSAFATAAFAACNGHDELCGRKYSNITFIGTHNSAFVGELPFNNQYISVSEQLNFGVRFLQAQTQDKNGDIQMCHTHCWQLNAGPLHNYLAEISGWIGKNPYEFVTILLTNVDALPIEKFDEAFSSAGLKDIVFRPKKRLSRDEWPTLQELLDDGTRVIVFMDYNMDESKVDYILDEFDYFWETPFGETDPSFPTCKVDRPEKGDPTVLMGIMNHMLNHDLLGVVMPDQIQTEKTNSEYSIQKQVDLCESSWGRRPNVVLLDWVNVGEAMDAQISLNGLRGSHS
ncbi:plc-like phosphodiesterase TIM beta alpha-barrel domain-containing protein [Fusarium napiforme]|uniref:Plc-like phosphodiesterase TIM beta alpha-barrel domain-containing protein n=1 Tax=Fusarium napiforme TaxID=42672 RepID=A0A8H5JSG4_9HYPO|nr:plc-like phosphodiesterase TIM beta alpha-barrel domain-containing protein [Fusarium napiforme]